MKGGRGKDLLAAPCRNQPSRQFLAGIQAFNRREFFQCHEILEELWLQEKAPIRDLYQGILQIGVGFYHLEGGNYKGAASLLRRGVRRLEPFAPSCLGVDMARLLAEAGHCLRTLTALGPGQLHAFDRALIPRVTLVSPVSAHLSAPEASEEPSKRKEERHGR